MAASRWFVAAAAAGVLTLGVAACGDDGEAASPTSMATTATPAMAGASEPATVVDVATSSGDFSTLVSAVEAAGLVDTLKGAGPFTVFAPTNEAFDALPDGTVEDLLKPENEDQLKAVLTYHVVPGKVLSSGLTDGMEVTTVEGEKLTVGVGADGVTLTDAAGNEVSVAKADIEAGNGVVHVIDGVLLPAS